MSMRGSPINWWKEKRQSSHSGVPHATRPQTAFPWNEDRDRDLSKIVEAAVLSAFESTAFKVAVASQVDPAFTRHQEKLSQIKTTNLNLESTLQAHVEDLPVVLKGIADHVTGLKIPDYGHGLEALAAGQERLESRLGEINVPDYSEGLNEIVSGQARFLKTFESRLSALESRLEDLDRKIGDVDEAVVNADMRSAIRFGEISNELQDRNTTLNNSIWEVERDLGKKTDALQRRVVGACEDVGKAVRGNVESIEAIKAKLEDDEVLSAVNKLASKAEFSEKAVRRNLASIQEKVALLDTSTMAAQMAKLEALERGMSDSKKEAEAARNLASVSSKFLSANTTKLDSMASAVGKMHLLVESTNEICQEVSESQETNASSVREDVEAVRMHVRSLDNLAVAHSRKLSDAASTLTRVEGAITVVTGRVGKVLDKSEGIEESLRPLSSHGQKLDGLETSLAGIFEDAKPQRKTLDALSTTIAEMRSNVDTALASHTDSLSSIEKTISGLASADGIATALGELQSRIENRATLEEVKTESKTISEALVREIEKSTKIGNHSTQSLLTELSRTQDSLSILQATTNRLSEETMSNFTQAASARKKALKSRDVHVDTILEAIHQQGKTMSSSVDAVQKDVLTGVQNMKLSLEAFVEKVVKEEAETTRNSTEGVKAVLESSSATLQDRLATGFENFSTEGKTSAKAIEAHVSTLSAAIKDEAKTTQARLETLHSHVLDEVQKTNTALRSSLTTIKNDIEQCSQSTSSTHGTILNDIKTLAPGLKAIDAAVRVNSAAIARVDKGVLESSSQVKAEIHSALQLLSSQLDDELTDMSRRVRGIAEYEIPRLEASVKRQRDAVEVIGGRIVGTTKRFDEMVVGFSAGKGGSGGGLEKSELLGMSGRLRGGSNASSTKSKDSAYRMGAFENGGRM